MAEYHRKYPPAKVGDVYGKWTVISINVHGARGGKRKCLCRCECGKECVVGENQLISNNSKACNSCGKRKHKIIKVGDTYEKWTVLEESQPGSKGERRLFCRCECGTERIVPETQFNQGKSKSCGLGVCKPEFKNLEDQTFGRWKVIKLSKKRKRKEFLWETICDCGNLGLVSSSDLLRGISKSCGCYKIDSIRERQLLSPGEAAFNQVFSSYKDHAKRRGYSFNLTAGEFKKITKLPCHFCNKPPSNIKKSNSGSGDYVYSGTDRVDNSVGYESENSVPCCSECNDMKSACPLFIMDKAIEFKYGYKAHIAALEKQLWGAGVRPISNPKLAKEVEPHYVEVSL